MTGLQIAAVGAVAILALVLAAISFDALQAVCSATLGSSFSIGHASIDGGGSEQAGNSSF